MTRLIELSQNFSLLLALTFLYGMIDSRLEKFPKHVQHVVKGLLFGSFGVISMTMPIQVQPGLFYDGRTIIIMIAGIFGGFVPAVIASVLVGVFRISLGGMGVPGALASIVTALVLGFFVRRYNEQHAAKTNARTFLLLGVIQALTGSLWGLIFSRISPEVLATTLPITLIHYPLGLLLIGSLVKYQQRNMEMERKLRDDQRRFLAIFNSTFQLTMLFKPDGTVVSANQAALDFGDAKLDDVVGQNFWATNTGSFTPENQRQLKEAFRRAVQGEFVRAEIELQNATQQWINFDFSLKPVRDEMGGIEMILLEGRDITTLKQLEAQKVDLLLEQERAGLLKKFISDVSHDLRTPLAVMRLNLDLLKRTTDPVKQQQRIETLAGQEEHLAQLLTDMTTMVSFDDAKATFRFKPLDPYFVAQLVFDEHHNAAHNKKQKLLFNHGREAMLIQADQGELEQALNKLYDNALTYTPPDGIITLSVFPHDNHAVFELRDTGIGISEEDLPEIFNRFFRADVSRNMHTGGAGLGLSIAKKIAEVHGGTIEAESTLGKGSTFRLMLPLITPETQTSQVPSARLYG